MEGLAQYIYSICGAGLICAVLRHLTKQTAMTGAFRLVTGVFLLLTLLLPLKDLPLGDISGIFSNVRPEAEQAVAQGQASYQKALADSISQRTEAYILTKGNQLGVSLSVEVMLSQDALLVPVSVRLSGNVSPYAKSRLQQILENDLGIPKEDQIWT